MRKGRKRGEPFTAPDSWDAHEEFADALGVWTGPKIKLRVELSKVLARYARRWRWTRDQTHEDLDDGRVIVTLIARDTVDTVNWVLQFGENAVVLEPASLRVKLATVTAKMAALYSGR